MKVEENIFYEDQSLKLTELEKKIFEYDQKIQLRNRLMESLKDQVKKLEKNNNQLLESFKLKSIELEDIKNEEINNFQKTIKVLKKEVTKQNNDILLFEKKNLELSDQIQLLSDMINKLKLQKDDMSNTIKNLQKNIIDITMSFFYFIKKYY